MAIAALLIAPFAALIPVTTARAIPPNSKPWNITAGPDGAMWFTELEANKIGRITMSGAITEYAIPTADAGPYDIVAGSDGALWFTETNASKIGRITTDGTITEYDVHDTANNSVKPTDIGKNYDGTLWFAGIGGIGKISSGNLTWHPLTGEYSGRTVSNLNGSSISGVWFSIAPSLTGAAGGFGRVVNANGDVATYPFLSGIEVTGISDGPQDGIWFTTVSKSPSGQIVSSLLWRIAESGNYFTPYALPTNSNPSYITTGIGDAERLWYSGFDNNTVVHFMRGSAPDVVTQLAPGSCPRGLTAGPDGAMWFTETCSNKIGRVDANGTLTEYPITGIPATPTNLTATSPATQANLSWTASVGASTYNIYRNGSLVGTTSNTNYVDSPVSGNYNYYVKAVGASGQESDPSNTLNVIVATAPIVTITKPTNNSTVSGTVNITGTIYSASNYSRMLYVFNSNGQAVVSKYQFSVPNSTTTMSHGWDTTQVPNGLYTLNLSARDSQGNKDTNSTSVIKVTVQN